MSRKSFQYFIIKHICCLLVSTRVENMYTYDTVIPLLSIYVYYKIIRISIVALFILASDF